MIKNYVYLKLIHLEKLKMKNLKAISELKLNLFKIKYFKI